VTLENTAGTKMTCTKASESGEYAGIVHEKNVTLTLTGCALSGTKCTSTGKEGEVVSGPLEGELGWQERTANERGRRVMLMSSLGLRSSQLGRDRPGG
jgi:hypothetical protein